MKLHNTLDTQFHDFLIELGTQLLYALRMKNKSMWTVHNSFGRWWPLRVHMMVHLDMNWSGDNLLTIFSFHGASFDTAKDLLIKLCIKPSIGDKHFFTFSLKPKLWTTSSKIVKFQLSKYFFSIKNQPNISDFFSCEEYLIGDQLS